MNCACLTFEITSLHIVIENWHFVQWLCGLECVYKTQYTFRIGPLKKSRRNQTNKLTNRDELYVIEWKQSLLSLLPTRIQSIIIIISAATAVAIVTIATSVSTSTITINHSFTQNEQIWQSCSCCAVVPLNFSWHNSVDFNMEFLWFHSFNFPFHFSSIDEVQHFSPFLLFFLLYLSYFHPAKHSDGIRFSQGFSFYLYKTMKKKNRKQENWK